MGDPIYLFWNSCEANVDFSPCYSSGVWLVPKTENGFTWNCGNDVMDPVVEPILHQMQEMCFLPGLGRQSPYYASRHLVDGINLNVISFSFPIDGMLPA